MMLINLLLVLEGYLDAKYIGLVFTVCAFIAAGVIGGIAGTVRWVKKNRRNAATVEEKKSDDAKKEIKEATDLAVAGKDAVIQLQTELAEGFKSQVSLREQEKFSLENELKRVRAERDDFKTSAEAASAKIVQLLDLNLGLNGQMTEIKVLAESNLKQISELTREIENLKQELKLKVGVR